MEIGIEKKFDLFTVQTSREAFFGEKTQATKWCFLLSQRSNGNKYKKVLFFLKRKEREKKNNPYSQIFLVYVLRNERMNERKSRESQVSKQKQASGGASQKKKNKKNKQRKA